MNAQLNAWADKLAAIRKNVSSAELSHDGYDFIQIRRDLIVVEQEIRALQAEFSREIPTKIIVDAGASLRRQLGNADDGTPEDLHSQDQHIAE